MAELREELIKMCRHRLFLILIISALLVLTLPGPMKGQAAAAISPDFNWNMADRFGLDSDHNGIIDIPNTLEYVNPSGGFKVNLDASSSQGGTFVSYNWRIEGNDLLVPILFWGSSPTQSVRLQQGLYRVTLSVTDDQGQTASVTQPVLVKDILIVAMGDSYASGEGNPDLPNQYDAEGYLTQDAVWTDSMQCHRSMAAGPAQAALEIENADPHTSVTFVFLACSGATIADGGLKQVDDAKSILGNRANSLDVLTLSLGGNDIGFSQIIMALVMLPGGMYVPLPGLDYKTWDSQIIDNLRDLEGFYGQLHQRIQEKLDPVNIYVTEYPDMTTGEWGESWTTCPLILNDVVFSGFVLFDLSTGINFLELNWARSFVLERLNDRIRNTIEPFGWNFVSGISERFLRHGYCASENWIRTANESVTLQGPITPFNNLFAALTIPLVKGLTSGSVHPTAEGHKVYKERLLESIRPKLYTNMGINSVSVSPEAALVGRHIAYTIELTNNGPSQAKNVRLIDELPNGVQFIECTRSDGGHCTISGNKVVAEPPSILPGASVWITISGKVDCSVGDKTDLTNIATLSALTPDPYPGDNLSILTSKAYIASRPALACPPDRTVSAISGAGAIVTYPVPDISGNCSPVEVACSPSSGAQFAIGTQDVACTAKYSGTYSVSLPILFDSSFTSSCDFSVTVTGAAEQLYALLKLAPGNIQGILEDALHPLLDSINNGDDKTGCDILSAFIQKVEEMTRNNVITAGDANQVIDAMRQIKDVVGCPTLDTIGSLLVNEGSLINITVSGSDPDGDLLTYAATGLPGGASFVPTTRTFSWTPDYSQAGSSHVVFTVTDPSGAADSERVEIQVREAELRVTSDGSSSSFPEGGYNAYASFDAQIPFGASTPSGWLTFTSSRTRRKVVSTGIASISVAGKTAVITGPCTLNGVSGYSFIASVGDNATPGSGADTFSIAMTGPNGFKYTASGTINSGDYIVSE